MSLGTIEDLVVVRKKTPQELSWSTSDSIFPYTQDSYEQGSKALESMFLLVVWNVDACRIKK